MKVLLSLVLLAAAPLAAAAQTADNTRPTPPGLVVEESEWFLDHPRFFGYTMGDRSGGGASGPTIHPIPRPGNSLSYSSGTGGGGNPFSGPDATWRRAQVRLKNAGAVAVKKVQLDFVFNDPKTGEELLRLPYSSRRRLKPGRSNVYTTMMNRTKRTRRGDGARMSVEFTKVVYADGSTWERGGESLK